jgi:hypothetical protein
MAETEVAAPGEIASKMTRSFRAPREVADPGLVAAGSELASSSERLARSSAPGTAIKPLLTSRNNLRELLIAATGIHCARLRPAESCRFHDVLRRIGRNRMVDGEIGLPDVVRAGDSFHRGESLPA